MIVCSCNVISDREVRNAASASEAPCRMTEVYRRLGRTPECGRCKRTIKDLVLETCQQHRRTGAQQNPVGTAQACARIARSAHSLPNPT